MRQKSRRVFCRPPNYNFFKGGNFDNLPQGRFVIYIFILFHLDFFPENGGILSDEYGEGFRYYPGNMLSGLIESPNASKVYL